MKLGAVVVAVVILIAVAIAVKRKACDIWLLYFHLSILVEWIDRNWYWSNAKKCVKRRAIGLWKCLVRNLESDWLALRWERPDELSWL